MFAALPAAHDVNTDGASAPGRSLGSTLPDIELVGGVFTAPAPSSTTPNGPSFTAVGVSSTARITRLSLAVVPPTPLTVSATLSLKPVASTVSLPVGDLLSLSIVALSV